MMKAVKDVDAYLALHPPAVRAQLNVLRQLILKAAPAAQETISYGMPGYKHHGVLVYFAATQQHLGFYPTPSAITAFKNELKAYDTAKGTIRFPLDKPLPKKLISDLVKFRVLENEAKAAETERVRK
jgi:uncharacterized protein YdhG (YjbR/CyaY superfamily)